MEKSLRWRDIGKTAKPLHKLLENGKELPRKYTPSRLRSQSVDVLFNTSRQRTNNSMEMQNLNQTKPLQENSNNSKIFKDKLEYPDRRIQNISSYDIKTSKNSLIKFPTLETINHQSSSQKVDTRIVEMKREFRSFKENVLQQLSRQKELVLTMNKQILNKMESQFRRLFAETQKPRGNKEIKEKGNMQLEISSNLNNPITKNGSLVQPKEKAPLQRIQDLGNKQKQSISSLKVSTEKRQASSLCDNNLNIKNLLGGLSTLKKQIFQMDKLFEGVVLDEEYKDNKK